MKDYKGKIVFLEKKDPSKSNYGSGEFIVLEQSPNNLYVLGVTGGYGSHSMETKPLVGADAFVVLTDHDDQAFVKRFVRDLRHFADTPKRGEKVQWVESVYDGARRNAQKLEAMLCDCGETPGTLQKIAAIDAKSHKFMLNGHLITVTID
jgi:hypothetical protein